MFEDMTPESIKKSILNGMDTDMETGEGSFLDHMAGPVALELWKAYQAMNALVPIAYIDEGSGAYIDLRCAEYGIERKAGKKAAADMTLVGKAGTVIPAGTAFLSADGLAFLLLEVVTLTGGEDRGKAEAEEAGAVYNVEAGALTQMVVTLPGLDTWSNAAAEGGADPESDAALVERLYDRLQRPATSGNAYHYEQWAKEVDGVGAVRVTPLWAGPGTVKVLVAGPEKEPVDGDTVAACAAHIEELRPIGAEATVQSARGLPVNVAATVTTDGSVTKEQVRSALADKLDAYLKSIAFSQYTLLYNRVAFLLLEIGGVTDYTLLTVNGGTGNVSIGAEEVPVLGTVTVS